MSLHLGPAFVMASHPRPARVCVRAWQSGPKMLRAYWQSGCRKMAIRKQDIKIAQHDDVTVQIDMLDQASNPLDISGFQSLTWIIAESVTGVVLLTYSTSDGSLILPSATRAVAPITAAQSGALPARRLYHEFRGINSGGDAQTMVAGAITVIDTRIADT